MPDTHSTLPAVTAADPSTDALQQIPGTLERGAADIAQLPLFEHLSAVMPAADLILGGAMLVFIILVHAAGVRSVISHVSRRLADITRRPALWRADLLMGGSRVHAARIAPDGNGHLGRGAGVFEPRRGLAIRGLFRGQYLYDRRLRQLRPAGRVADAGADHRDVRAVHVRLVRQRACRHRAADKQDQGRGRARRARATRIRASSSQRACLRPWQASHWAARRCPSSYGCSWRCPRPAGRSTGP